MASKRPTQATKAVILPPEPVAEVETASPRITEEVALLLATLRQMSQEEEKVRALTQRWGEALSQATYYQVAEASGNPQVAAAIVQKAFGPILMGFLLGYWMGQGDQSAGV